jgi:hypothetical protein
MEEVNTDSIPLSKKPIMKLNSALVEEKMYEVKKENVMLKMRLVKIMVLLDNVKNAMEKAKDGIVAQLCDVNLELPEN